MTKSAENRVLILDDDPAAGSALARMVTLFGARAVAVSKLADATALLRSGTWDLLLLDLYLAEGQSLDLLPALRVAGGLPPIVLISGVATVEALARAMEKSVVGFVSKPATPFAIAAAIERALGASPVLGELTRDSVPLLRRTIADLARIDGGGDQGITLAKQRIQSSPRLIAANLAHAESHPESSARAPSAATSTDQAAAMLVGAALLTTAWSVDGPWSDVLVARAERALEEATSARKRVTPSKAADPATAELCTLLDAVAPLSLLTTASMSPTHVYPEPLLLERIEEQGRRVATSVLLRWGLPEATAQRIAQMRQPASTIAATRSEPAQPQPLVTGPPAPQEAAPDTLPLVDLMRAAQRHEQATWTMRISESLASKVEIYLGRRALLARLREVSGKQASIDIASVEPELLDRILQDARLEGLWMQVVGRGAQGSVRVPLEVADIDRRFPATLTARLGGAPQQIERLRHLLIQLSNLRSSVRVAAPADPPLVATLAFQGLPQRLAPALIDMSLEGAGLVLAATDTSRLVIGHDAELVVEMAPGEDAIRLLGRVVYSQLVCGVDPETGQRFSALRAGFVISSSDSELVAARSLWPPFVMKRQRELLRAGDIKRDH